MSHFRDEGPFSHDLALVKIRRKAGGAGVRISDSVAPVCLPGQGTRIQDGTSCVISGWGKLLCEYHGCRETFSPGMFQMTLSCPLSACAPPQCPP